MIDDSSKKIYLVLEYLERGEVHWQDADGNPILTVDESRDVARDVVSGLEYLHFQGIIHRDIKPANLLRDRDGIVKISDFGVSYASNLDSETNDELELAKTAGTPAFFAPELCATNTVEVETRPLITNKIDVWSFGVTLFCLIFGKLPFSAENEFELFDVIAQDPLVFPDEVPVFPVPRKKRGYHSIFYSTEEQDDSSISNPENDSNRNSTDNNDISIQDGPQPTPNPDLDSVKDLLRQLLEKDPAKRIDVYGIKHHPWMMEGMDNPRLEHFLTATADEQRIVVTNEEVQKAVLGLGSRIKRGLSRLGSSALHFAGFRRKGSSSSSSANQSRDPSSKPISGDISPAPGAKSNPQHHNPPTRSETARHNKKYFDQAVFTSRSDHESDFSTNSSSKLPQSKTHSRNVSQNVNEGSLMLIDQAIMNNRSASSSFSSLSSMSSLQSSPQATWHTSTRDHIASGLSRSITQTRESNHSSSGAPLMMGQGLSDSHSHHGYNMYPSSRHSSYSGPSNPRHNEEHSLLSPITPMAEMDRDAIFMNDLGSSITSADTTTSNLRTPSSRLSANNMDTPIISSHSQNTVESVSSNPALYPPNFRDNGLGKTDSLYQSSGDRNSVNFGRGLSPVRNTSSESFPRPSLHSQPMRMGKLSASASNLDLHSIIAGTNESRGDIIREDDESIDPHSKAHRAESVITEVARDSSTSRSPLRREQTFQKHNQASPMSQPPPQSGLATACPSPSVNPYPGLEAINQGSSCSLNSMGSSLVTGQHYKLGKRVSPSVSGQKYSSLIMDQSTSDGQHVIANDHAQRSTYPDPGRTTVRYDNNTVITNPRLPNTVRGALDLNASDSATTHSSFQYSYAQPPSKEFSVDDDFSYIGNGTYDDFDVDRDERDDDVFKIPTTLGYTSGAKEFGSYQNAFGTESNRSSGHAYPHQALPSGPSSGVSSSVSSVSSSTNMSPTTSAGNSTGISPNTTNARPTLVGQLGDPVTFSESIDKCVTVGSASSRQKPHPTSILSPPDSSVSLSRNNSTGVAFSAGALTPSHRRTTSTGSRVSQINRRASLSNRRYSSNSQQQNNSDTSSDEGGELTLVVERRSENSPARRSSTSSTSGTAAECANKVTTGPNSLAASSLSSPITSSVSSPSAATSAGTASSLRNAIYSDSPLTLAVGKLDKFDKISPPASPMLLSNPPVNPLSNVSSTSNGSKPASALSSRVPSQVSYSHSSTPTHSPAPASVTTSRLSSSTKLEKEAKKLDQSIVQQRNSSPSRADLHHRGSTPSVKSFGSNELESIPLPTTLVNEISGLQMIAPSFIPHMSPTGTIDDMEHIVTHHTVRRAPVSNFIPRDVASNPYAYLTQRQPSSSDSASTVQQSVPASPVANNFHTSSRMEYNGKGGYGRYGPRSPRFASSSGSSSHGQSTVDRSDLAALSSDFSHLNTLEGSHSPTMSFPGKLTFTPTSLNAPYNGDANVRAPNRLRSKSVAVGEVQYHRQVTDVHDDYDDDYSNFSRLQNNDTAISKKSLGYGSTFTNTLFPNDDEEEESSGSSDEEPGLFIGARSRTTSGASSARDIGSGVNSVSGSAIMGGSFGFITPSGAGSRSIVGSPTGGRSGIASPITGIRSGVGSPIRPAVSTSCSAASFSKAAAPLSRGASSLSNSSAAKPSTTSASKDSDDSDDGSDGSDGLFSGNQRRKAEAAKQQEKERQQEAQRQIQELQKRRMEQEQGQS